MVKKAAMRSGVLRLASKAGARRVVILRYHSVLSDPKEFDGSIGSGIIHSSMIFAQQMQLVASKYHPVTLDQVCAFLSGEKDLPRGAVVTTFDDGFADNLEIAAPILSRYGIPAAFYLAVDYIGNHTQAWYVRLRNAFTVSKVPQWKTDDSATFNLSVPEERRQAFLDSSRRCAKLCRAPQEELLGAIEKELNVAPFAVPVMLTWDGARELIRQGHIVGSHSLSHPNLAFVNRQELTDEIVASKAEIEKNVGCPVAHFSYPSPIMEPHFSSDSVEVTQKANYRTAVTCQSGPVERGDNTLSLKRIFAPQTFAEFEWALENSFLGRIV
jgi:peptidoglycan/xylan/chitin deacetylase (PgdA/CDA1 family)